jgi:hypothetical protein
MRLKAHNQRSKHIELDYDFARGGLMSTTSYVQRHEPTPGDAAEALEYYSGCVRAYEQDVRVSYPAFDRTDPAKHHRACVILDALATLTHNYRQGGLFLDSTCERRAELSKFIPDGEASNRTRTSGISLQRSF